jgi:hypothetical protein
VQTGVGETGVAGGRGTDQTAVLASGEGRTVAAVVVVEGATGSVEVARRRGAEVGFNAAEVAEVISRGTVAGKRCREGVGYVDALGALQDSVRPFEARSVDVDHRQTLLEIGARLTDTHLRPIPCNVVETR